LRLLGERRPLQPCRSSLRPQLRGLPLRPPLAALPSLRRLSLPLFLQSPPRFRSASLKLRKRASQASQLFGARWSENGRRWLPPTLPLPPTLQ
jgi:hypothetical protein